MGKFKKRTAAAFSKVHPFCCFCGGTEPTRTIDHQPATIFFPNKIRLAGLEFPACEVCQNQTRKHEPLAALIARMTGGHRPSVGPDAANLNAAKAVMSAFPDWGRRVIRRSLVNVNGIYQTRLTINTADPEARRSVCLLAAKFALAAYYEVHGKSCPPAVKINTLWTHSQHKDARTQVAELLKRMPGYLGLKQGSQNADGTFYLRYLSEGENFWSMAILHESLALIAHISRSTPTAEWIPWEYIWMPSPGHGIIPFEL